MTFFKYGAIILLAIFALTLLILAVLSRKPIRFLLFNSFIGVCILLILYLTRKFTGLNIALNPYTVSASAILGAPAVFGLMILNFIILM